MYFHLTFRKLLRAKRATADLYLIKTQTCLARQSVREQFDLSISYDQATFFLGESSTQQKFMARNFVIFDIQTYVYMCKALLYNIE